VHQLSDGRYLLRIGDSNVPFPADQIDAIKAGKRRRIAEARYVPDAAIGDLDPGLLDELRERSGWNLPDEQLLERFRLAEPRDGRLALTLAALLLFGRDPGRWHPRGGIDFIKHEGTERRFGADLNIVKRVRLEAPLVRLIEQSYEAIEPHIRERQRLVDLFFEERMEYPPFAWQEAIVNAVAHRDYGYEGLGIEIWMFDNRIEVRSPGQLVEPVTLERLRRRERIHASRNPRLVRVLTEWGYMREQGEGVPRMYEAMEAEGLYPPSFQIEADVIFAVILRNEPVYSPETRRWLRQYDGMGLTGDQKRLLAYAKEHDGTFTSQAYQRLASVDIYQASKDIKDLIRKDLVRLPSKGGRVYELRQAERISAPEPPPEYRVLLPILEGQGFVRNRDIRDALGVSSLKANRIAKALEATGWLRREGNRRGTRYLAVRD
jgi:ATP-dependent DNA helicase RecG